MLLHLKIKLASLVAETRIIRSKERHYRGNARQILGIFSKKHNKEEPKPEMPEKMKKASTINDIEEKKARAQRDYDIYWNLHQHRKNVVRKEARATNLAIGFLRGKFYEEMEFFAHEDPDWDKIERMACVYSDLDPREVKVQIEEWIAQAKHYLATVRKETEAEPEQLPMSMRL